MVKDITRLSELKSFNPKTSQVAQHKNSVRKINQKLLCRARYSRWIKCSRAYRRNGYRTAKVVGNELVDARRRICQVTSTVYNAVLLSGLEVVERRNHSIPLSYIEMGRDATISHGYIDFRFKNNSGYAIFLETEAADGRVYVSIWGKCPDVPRTVKIRTRIIETIEPEGIETKEDETLSPGDSVIDRDAVPGCIVEVYRDTYDINGNLIKTEKISVDTYQPQKKVIRVAP